MTQGPPPPDDERTVINDTTNALTRPGGEQTARESSAFGSHGLPGDTMIEGFRITRMIGEGGFGIVYLAWDTVLERNVAIKEYMPSSLAVRSDASLGISVRFERNRETFDAGLKSFVNEARMLARFDHPALVKVFRFWEANCTAYMAMPYYEGPTLRAVLAGIGGPVPEEQLRGWLRPLLDALSVIHREKCYHRDISPDNILLTSAGPLLLDFGAARRVISDMTQALTAVLKPGYAPIEQYGGAMLQGPWTDLYALAGVMYCAITGRPPLTSVERVVNDTLKPLAETHAGRYHEGFLRAIDAALAVRPEARPQSAAQFRELLDVGLAPDSPLLFRPSGFGHSDYRISAFDRLPATEPPTAARTPVRPAAEPPTSTVPRRLGKGVYAVAVVVVLAAGGAAWWLKVRGTPAPTVVPAPVPGLPKAIPAPEPAPAPGPTAAPEPAPSSPTIPAPEPSAAPLPAPLPPRRPAVPPSPPVERPKPPPISRPAPEPKKPVRPEAEAANPKVGGGKPARCGDIVQKSSLESLSPEEVAYLKRECR